MNITGTQQTRYLGRAEKPKPGERQPLPTPGPPTSASLETPLFYRTRGSALGGKGALPVVQGKNGVGEDQ